MKGVSHNYNTLCNIRDFKYDGLYLTSDLEYGTHVVYSNGDVCFSYFTDYEKLDDIINELVIYISHYKERIE